MNAVPYDSLLAKILRENALGVFAFDGTPQPLDYARHVDTMLPKDAVPRQLHLQLAFDLWASWELRLEQSSYELAHLGAVHIEAAWVDSGLGGPPCVLLMNSDFRSTDEIAILPPVAVAWKAAELGPLEWTRLEVEDVGVCYRAYRKAG